MANRVILHIGPRKTGTTCLQNTLWENQQRLADQGFYLPLGDVKQQFEAASRADPPPMTVTDAELVEEAVRTIVGLLDQAAERDRVVRRLRRGLTGGSGAAGRS